MTSWSAPVTRHLLEHRFWVDLNANSVFSSDGIITSKYSSFVPWAEMELELWANCAKIKKCNQEKKLATYWILLRCNDLQPRFLLLSYYIELAWSLKLRLFLSTLPPYFLFCQFVHIGLPKLLFLLTTKKIVSSYFCHSLTFLIVKKERIFVKNKLISCYWWRRI